MAGELQWTAEIEEIANSLQAATSDSAKTIYVADAINIQPSWAPYARISAISPTGDHQWTTGLGYGGVQAMVPRGEGIVALLNDGFFQGFSGSATDSRPLVGHIDADGDLIAVDVGNWNGVGHDVIVGDDGSVLVLIRHESEDTAYQVRKYLIE